MFAKDCRVGSHTRGELDRPMLGAGANQKGNLNKCPTDVYAMFDHTLITIKRKGLCEGTNLYGAVKVSYQVSIPLSLRNRRCRRLCPKSD